MGFGFSKPVSLDLKSICGILICAAKGAVTGRKSKLKFELPKPVQHQMEFKL